MRQIMKAGVLPPDRRTKEFEAILGKEGSTYWAPSATGSFAMKAWWGSYAASARDRLWHDPDGHADAAKLFRNLAATCRAGRVLAMRSRRREVTRSRLRY